MRSRQLLKARPRSNRQLPLVHQNLLPRLTRQQRSKVSISIRTSTIVSATTQLQSSDLGTTDNTTTQTVSADSGYGISHSHAVALVLTHTTRIQGELEHRRVKQFYAHTNKTVKFAWQIARHQRRQAYLHRLQLEQPQTTLPIRSQTKHNRKAPAHRSQLPRIPLQLPFEASEPLPPSSPKEHYQISEEQAHPVDLPEYLTTNRDDPSFKVRCPHQKVCI